jgi:hypothetical protein
MDPDVGEIVRQYPRHCRPGSVTNQQVLLYLVTKQMDIDRLI